MLKQMVHEGNKKQQKQKWKEYKKQNKKKTEKKQRDLNGSPDGNNDLKMLDDNDDDDKRKMNRTEEEKSLCMQIHWMIQSNNSTHSHKKSTYTANEWTKASNNLFAWLIFYFNFAFISNSQFLCPFISFWHVACIFFSGGQFFSLFLLI